MRKTLKKNVINRNMSVHPEVRREEYESLIGEALYSPDAIIPSKKPEKPNYYHFIKHMEETNSVI